MYIKGCSTDVPSLLDLLFRIFDKMMKWILVSYCAAITLVAVAGFSGVETITPEDVLEDLDHVTPDWIKVVEFDLTKGDNCPKPWRKILINGTAMCQSSHHGKPGCPSAVFSVNGIEYNKIRGMVRGYQKGSTDSFNSYRYQRVGINGAYVDGVSITLASSPRKHVWTYASGLSSDGYYPDFNCPCAVVPGPSPPSFVGENYYCDSGNQGSFEYDTYHTDNPLWDGTGCENVNDNCCADVDAPWFHREFTTTRVENLEVRICANQKFDFEGVLIDQLALYVQ